MLVKQELTMNLSMKCFPAQKRNYDIETLIPKMPNADEKNHYLLIFNSIRLGFDVRLHEQFIPFFMFVSSFIKVYFIFVFY